MNLEFENKVALITGAASGFGQAAARMLAEGGAIVVGVDRDEVRLQSACDALPRPANSEHFLIVKDLRPAAAGGQVVAEAMRRAGHLDILVNSAGVCHFRPINEIRAEEWDEVLEIDLRALHFTSVAAAEAMDSRHGGRIINIGSNAGRKGRPLSAHYAAAKAGVVNLTESLALAYGSRGITVNTVCPAVVLTGMWDRNFSELHHATGKTRDQLVAAWTDLTPLKRLGTEKDVANLIAFLASERAAFITGQNINVCGGFMLTC